MNKETRSFITGIIMVILGAYSFEQTLPINEFNLYNISIFICSIFLIVFGINKAYKTTI